MYNNYLSKDTQNELIRLISEMIISRKLSGLKCTKYYSVILDCTFDISYFEKMSVILRYVNCKLGESTNIWESSVFSL